MPMATYELSPAFGRKIADHLAHRLQRVCTSIRQAHINEHFWDWFTETDLFIDLQELRAQTLYPALYGGTEPKFLVDGRGVSECEQWIVHPKRPKEWERLPNLTDIIWTGYLTTYASGQPAIAKVEDILKFVGEWETWVDAGKYYDWAKEIKALTNEYINPEQLGGGKPFRNINQIYWSFPQLLEACATCPKIEQGRHPTKRTRSGMRTDFPKIDIGRAIRECKENYNKKRRPNIHRRPPQRLKELVGTLLLVTGDD